LYSKTRFNFDTKGEGDMRTAREQIEQMLNATAVTENGVAVTKAGKKVRMHELNNNFKHLSIDESMHIDKAVTHRLKHSRAQTSSL
jgi:hypothetical protein